MKTIKKILNVIIFILSLFYISSIYMMGYYKEQFQDIRNEAIKFNMSSRWAIREHIKTILACVFLAALNLASIVTTFVYLFII